LLGLRRRHLDVAAKLELTVDDVEYRVRAPVLWVGRAAARTRAAAPFVGENDLCAVVAERRGVPVREARIDHLVHPRGIHRIGDIEQNAVTRACTGGEPELGEDGDVVTLVGLIRLLRVRA